MCVCVCVCVCVGGGSNVKNINENKFTKKMEEGGGGGLCHPNMFCIQHPLLSTSFMCKHTVIAKALDMI